MVVVLDMRGLVGIGGAGDGRLGFAVTLEEIWGCAVFAGDE